MKAISLFSGGGGMDFALRQMGVDVVFANDVCSYACETLRKYFPETDVVCSDVREISSFPSADLIVGGYPCQSFSLAGLRRPSSDPRTYLFREFARAISQVQPKHFVAENVSGMAGVEGGKWLKEQIRIYAELGYIVTHHEVNARDYGIPQRRRRIFLVGTRRDVGAVYAFPAPTHGKTTDVKRGGGLKRYVSHGEAIRHLPIWPAGEFYERPHDPEGHMSWYYMSRNRKAPWNEPSFCIVANFRHVTLHPACQTMKLVWSNLKDGFKQKWEFSGEYEHTVHDASLPVLEVPRRLSWREAAAIQTFPAGYEPVGDLEKKFEQIGNAVPPGLFSQLLDGLIDGSSFRSLRHFSSEIADQGDLFQRQSAE